MKSEKRIKEYLEALQKDVDAHDQTEFFVIENQKTMDALRWVLKDED